jgi:hypothetical protein
MDSILNGVNRNLGLTDSIYKKLETADEVYSKTAPEVK